jgi:hypothetical protein
MTTNVAVSSFSLQNKKKNKRIIPAEDHDRQTTIGVRLYRKETKRPSFTAHLNFL